MDDIINLFDAETVWIYINNKEQQQIGKRQEYYLNCAKKFGILCSLASKKTEDLSIDEEYINAYNEISKEIIRRIDTKSKITLKDIGNSIESNGKINNTIRTICYGDTNGIDKEYALDGQNINEYLNEDNKFKIISNYGTCLNALKNAYGTNALYDFFTKKKEKRM